MTAVGWELRVLGPVTAYHKRRRLDLGPRRQRFILAVLALEVNQPVSMDRLVDLCWPTEPPRTAVNAVRVSVSRLRGALEQADVRPDQVELATQGSGYLLRTEPLHVDVHRFRALTNQARQVAGDEERVALLDRALDLWRGPALDGTVPAETRRQVCHRLDEARFAAADDRLDALLRLGRHHEVLDELSRRVDADPLRERAVVQLMVALYRCGRRADALAAYQVARRRLAEELGLDPGPELQQLQFAILRDDHAVGATTGAATPTVQTRAIPRQLPAVVTSFTGRSAQLRELDTLLADGASAGAPVIVTAIAGSAGVGKTALAVHWAHRVADRFPDGQLYVNLHGYAAGPPTQALDVLAHLLRSLGVPAEQVPADLDAAAGAYRSTVAGRRVLVLLDNAASPEQVRPLLPGDPGCLVLVTSRDRLGGLVALDGAHRLVLDVLSADEAYTLLSRILGAGRVAAEPDAVRTLARLCANLPLAMRVAAAHLADQPGRRIAAYVAELSRGDRLVALQVDGDRHTSVRAAFELSLAALPVPAQRLFRLLGLVPGPDVSEQSAAALSGCSPEQARRLLDRLAAAHLIDQPAPGRFSFHDLLRLYAAQRCEAEDSEPDRAAALDRLLSFHLRGADAAALRLYPQMQRLPGTADADVREVPFDEPAEALDWLDAERASLAAAARHAAMHGPRPVAWRLSDALRGYFWLRPHVVSWLDVAQAGLAAATTEGDTAGQAAAHLSLAQVKRRMSRPDEADEHYGQAGALARRAGWLEGEAAALASLADLYRLQGRLAEATDRCLRACATYAQTGRRAGEAASHGNLGHIYVELGRLHDAADHYERGRMLYEQVGSAAGVANSLASLGTVCRMLGRLDDASHHLEQALRLHREVDGIEGESDTLVKLAELRHNVGLHTEAVDLAHTALAVARDRGVQTLEVEALNVVGAGYQRLGREKAAVSSHGDARDLAREIGYRPGEIAALTGLAIARLALGEVDDAATHAGQALGLALADGFRLLQADALTALAAVAIARGRDDEADRYTAEVRTIDQETGYSLR